MKDKTIKSDTFNKKLPIKSAGTAPSGSTALAYQLHALNPSTLINNHDFFLATHLQGLHLHRALQADLKVITWNVNQLDPCSVDLRQLLATESYTSDIYIINLQETIVLTSFRKSNSKIKEWSDEICHVLSQQRSYRVLHSEGLLGLTTLLVAHDEISQQIHNIETKTLGLGYLRWGNKGCISLTFTLGGLNDFDIPGQLKKIPGVKVQNLNVHLVHGEGEAVVQQRYDSWFKIGEKIGLVDSSVALTDSSKLEIDEDNNNERSDKSVLNEKSSNFELSLSEAEQFKLGDSHLFQNPETTIIKDLSTAVVIAGDTNYRLMTGWDRYAGSSFDRSAIDTFLKEGNYLKLIEVDQLTNERLLNKIMLGFTEGQIQFAPTFKINSLEPNLKNVSNNTSFVPNYDSKRLPAYTDRILYVPRDYFFLKNYNSYPMKGSDHLPVFASFDLNYTWVDWEMVVKGRESFSRSWDSIINNLKVIQVSDKCNVICQSNNNHLDFFHLVTQTSKTDIPIGKPRILNAGVYQYSIDYNNGVIDLSCVSGETINFALIVSNVCDETVEFKITDQNWKKWFSFKKTKISYYPLSSKPHTYKDIDYSKNGSFENDQCTITAKGSVLVQVELATSQSSIEKIDTVLNLEIPKLSSLLLSKEYIALSVKPKNIFQLEAESLEKYQLENIRIAFSWLLKQPHFEIPLAKFDSLSPDNFNTYDTDIIRVLTLWQFDPTINQINTESIFKILFIWLKCQSTCILSGTKLGMELFHQVIQLIMWLNLEPEEAYQYFGWCFSDPDEVIYFLERENYKFTLHN
ncbi:hypothetical protein DAMA08_026810 [Martiniozyma asiatica (nom. inval.)]|nr:hypothetical protein DAMA08_026810 [Martiniozyma asiatica]